MHTERLNLEGRLRKRFIAERTFLAEPIIVIDVGASGGIDQSWEALGDQVRVFAFEPLVNEVKRLSATAPKNVEYIASFVTGGDSGFEVPTDVSESPLLARNNYSWERTSANRFRTERPGYDYVAREFNADQALEYTSDRTSLDEWCAGRKVSGVDFIKIDTDGHDLAVLGGARALLRESAVLAIFVECQFHGISHPNANTFANIDSYLRREGFSLADMEPYRYSRGTLPGMFTLPLSAQTTTGSLQFCDALYVRDVCLPDYEQIFSVALSGTKLLKAAMFYEQFGMPDCAAEILVKYRSRLEEAGVEVAPLLDDLTPTWDGKRVTFEEYNRRFSVQTDWFFPANRRDRNVPLRRVLSRVPGLRKLYGFYRGLRKSNL